jgi:hypothetical protein
MTGLIQPAPHEFNAQYNYADGLDAYFAFDSVVKQADGSRETQFRHEGELWNVTLYYQESNICHPGDTTPAGTPFEIENIREFRIQVAAADDTAGQRSFNAHLRPRWDGMEVESDDGTSHDLNVPFEEGVNLRITGSNIAFAEYLNLIQQAAHSLGVKWSYFADPHKSSNTEQAEMYVRVHKDKSGPVHARDGPLARMGHLLESDRDGHRKIEQRDMDERGEQLPGYRHQVGLDENRIQEILPDHSLPKRAKHYYAREALNKAKSDPLAHPKVGAIYYSNLWRDQDQKLGVSPDDLEQLQRELEDAVLSILHDAGLSVSDTAPYVSDAYFEAEITDRERQVVQLPLEEIEQNQESVVIREIADGLSPVEWEALDVLVTDGGEVAPADIADAGGFHIDSVHRALDRIDGMVEREYGTVELRSTYVGELVHDAINQAKEATRDAVEAGAKALDAAERGMDERTSALVAFASRYLESWRETDDGLRLDFGTIEADTREEANREIRRILREGKQLWDEMREDEMAWRMGKWRARIRYDENHELRSIDERKPAVYAAGGRLHDLN